MIESGRYTSGRIAVANLSASIEGLERRRAAAARFEELLTLSNLLFLRGDLLGRIVDHDRAERALSKRFPWRPMPEAESSFVLGWQRVFIGSKKPARCSIKPSRPDIRGGKLRSRGPRYCKLPDNTKRRCFCVKD